MTQQVLSITQVNEYIRSVMDQDDRLNAIAVKGEISNYKLYPSGHHYFTLKDDGAALKCVMFRGNAMRLRFRPENGMKIIAMGKISVYPRDGAYQLYCSSMTIDGVGDLHIAFEQLKAKLGAQGLFDPAHKKTLPKYPNTIGIITSSAGAAVHDMLRILNKRFPLAKVRLLPVRVQGAEAPGEIVAAIRYANLHQLADVLIVGRGGGSIEDLWAFNDEQVAIAIFQSGIPVISAVGHEPDVTISDYVADLRAATPSNAAELVVPDSENLKLSLDTMTTTMETILMRQLKNARQHLNTLASSPSLQSPRQYITRKRETLSLLKTKLLSSQQHSVALKRQRFVSLTATLDAISPLKVLTRGYTIVKTTNNTVIRSVEQLRVSDRINITMSDGEATAEITDIRRNFNDQE